MELSLKNSLKSLLGKFKKKCDETYATKLDNNKSLYNLNEPYDTAVDNGDGTSTITRKTGYLTFNGTEDWQDWSTNYGTSAQLHIAPINGIVSKEGADGVLKAISNGFDIRDGNWVWGAQREKSISITSRNGSIYYVSISIKGVNSGAAAKEYFSKNPCYIRYELATPYTEKVITKQPLLNLDQNGTQFLRDEWEKGLNLFNSSMVVLGQEISENGANISNADWWASNFIEVEPNTQYSKNIGDQYFFYYEANKTFIGFDKSGQTPNNCHYVRINDVMTIPPETIMFNKGSNAYSHTPYYGQIVRYTFERVWNGSATTLNTQDLNLADGIYQVTLKIVAGRFCTALLSVHYGATYSIGNVLNNASTIITVVSSSITTNNLEFYIKGVESGGSISSQALTITAIYKLYGPTQ